MIWKQLFFYNAVKRFIDIVVSMLFLIFLSPFYLVVFLAIFFQDGGNPIYIQKRVGKRKEVFNFIKFRSMVRNADELLFSDKKLYHKMRSGVHKVKDDPRITKIGKFIRKYSIDELPQFVNVLRGEMSFVGPRALRPDELAKFEQEHPEMKDFVKDVFKAKPGITGIWQVSGRSSIAFVERIKMDAFYANNPSIFKDLCIIIRTPFAVLKGEEAQ
ncbi:MAG: sugar transferase [bacterium]